jgi:hypothetical protein
MKRIIVCLVAVCATLATYASVTEYDLDSILAETALPVLYMSTDNGEELTGNSVYPPDGA